VVSERAAPRTDADRPVAHAAIARAGCRLGGRPHRLAARRRRSSAARRWPLRRAGRRGAPCTALPPPRRSAGAAAREAPVRLEPPPAPRRGGTASRAPRRCRTRRCSAAAHGVHVALGSWTRCGRRGTHVRVATAVGCTTVQSEGGVSRSSTNVRETVTVRPHRQLHLLGRATHDRIHARRAVPATGVSKRAH